MQTSKLKMFGKLYTKDLHEIWPELAVTIGLTVAILIVMLFATGNNNNIRNLAILPAILAIGLAGFLPIVSSFKLLSREWNNNTVYLIMSLPVSGTMIMGSKLLVLLTQYVLGTVLAGLSTLLIFYKTLNEIPQLKEIIASNPQVFSYLALFYVVSLVGIMYLCCSSFLAQILGAMFKKHSGFMTILSFIGILYVVGKIMHYLGSWFNFNQNIIVNVRTQMLGVDSAVLQSLGIGIAAYLIISIIIMVITITIYERKIEL